VRQVGAHWTAHRLRPTASKCTGAATGNTTAAATAAAAAAAASTAATATNPTTRCHRCCLNGTSTQHPQQA